MGSKSTHLQNVLETHRMKHVQSLMDKYIAKRNKVKEALEQKFTDKLASSAINSGSYAKHDAVNTKFDIDLCQPFKRNSFDTLEAMSLAVFNFFNEEYKKTDSQLIEVRHQNVSTGLTFVIENETIKMDVVPGRELNEGNYSISIYDLNLYVKAEGNNSIKTNIQTHIDNIKGKSEERSIIRLLKIWKISHKKAIKSFFVELITIRAFDNCSKKPTNLWEQLKMTMEYIRDNVTTIRMTDPANANNIVSDTLTASEKQALSNDIKKILADIERDEKWLSYYFPINLKYANAVKDAIAATIIKSNHKPFAY